MTTGHNIDALYTFEDPLGFQSTLPPSFNLPSCQSRDSFDSDTDDSDDDDGDWHFTAVPMKPLPQSKPTSVPGATTETQRESSTSSSSFPVCVRNTRVRFIEQPEIRCYEQADREDFGILFYSCHELQKMIDEAKKEKLDEGKLEWTIET